MLKIGTKSIETVPHPFWGEQLVSKLFQVCGKSLLWIFEESWITVANPDVTKCEHSEAPQQVAGKAWDTLSAPDFHHAGIKEALHY